MVEGNGVILARFVSAIGPGDGKAGFVRAARNGLQVALDCLHRAREVGRREQRETRDRQFVYVGDTEADVGAPDITPTKA